MSRLTIAGLLLVCVPFATAAQRTEGLPPPPAKPDFLIDTPLALDESFAIPVSKMASVEAAALEGDGASALAVSRHFSMGLNTDKEKARYWLLIAAENGNDIAQYNLWFHDHESDDPRKRKRALFWLEQARANGNERAVDELKKPHNPR